MDIIRLRSLCLSFSQTSEDVKWDNDLCLTILGKMYCIAHLGYPFRFSVKVEKDNLAEILAHRGVKPAPYLARYNWVLIEEETSLTDQELEQLIGNSYHLVVMGISPRKRAEAGLLQ
jgi:predicted DNA-binding protein (MmcQ/YjbR family)